MKSEPIQTKKPNQPSEESANPQGINGKDHLSYLCHELRSPLHAIHLLSSLLNDKDAENLTGQQQESIHTIHEVSCSLLQIIDQTLELARERESRPELSVQPVTISTFCTQLRNQFKLLAEEKGLELTITLEEPLPDKLYTDPLRLKQILTNLLSNAIKFTSEGSVDLTVCQPDLETAQQVRHEPDGMICFQVSDTGIGIPDSYQQQIFHRYQQLSHTRSSGRTEKTPEGSGLGLAISRDLAHWLGGEITVTSKEQVGSCFSLWIPHEATADASIKVSERASSQNSIIVENKQKSSSASGSNTESHKSRSNQNGVPAANHSARSLQKTILLVDDSRLHQTALAEYLQPSPIHVLGAETAREARDNLNRQPVDCIVLDLTLPDANGLELMRQLSEEPQTESIPIIIYTGRVLSARETEETERYAHAILCKNIGSYQKLMNELEMLFPELIA